MDFAAAQEKMPAFACSATHAKIAVNGLRQPSTSRRTGGVSPGHPRACPWDRPVGHGRVLPAASLGARTTGPGCSPVI